ncbi:ubiquitinyl hydrolase [Salix suchowensis]|nr:ubiquitinyl hydrolase [Salix suchowensis]
MKKLAIVEDREEDKYDHTLTIRCWKCDPNKGVECPNALSDPKAMSSARQSEVKAWEEEILPCEHTLTLEQFATGHIQTSGWFIRNGHALAHYQSTGHGVSVKLGTITPEGGAGLFCCHSLPNPVLKLIIILDIYCYSCDESKQDPNLSQHLATFGINVQTLKKTEKSITELVRLRKISRPSYVELLPLQQLEQNLSFDFSLTDESGNALEPVFGPGLTGLSNLGNSCYMASVLQSLFSLPAFQSRYNDLAKSHYLTCTISLPAECIECQMHKVADGLLSGRYSHPANYAADPKAVNPLAHDSPTPVFQEGIKPSGFKGLIGRGHEEFSTMKQQDAEEFLVHLLTILRRDAHKYKERSYPGRLDVLPSRLELFSCCGSSDATVIFTFGMEQRLQCADCKKVRYRVDNTDTVSVTIPAKEKSKDQDGKVTYEEVDLWQCIESLLGIEALEYACPSCQKTVHALKHYVDTPVLLPANDELLFTAQHLGQGVQQGEQELSNEEAGKLPGRLSSAAPTYPNLAPILPAFNDIAMAQLEGMGFPTIRCQKALLATGIVTLKRRWSGCSVIWKTLSGDPERAVEWLFNHPDDMGEDEMTSSTESSSQTQTILGTKDVPIRYRLKAFISHKGPSAHSGHYVAHIRVDDTNWVLFNDEKVVKADAESVKELKKLAYLYIFEKA